VEQQPLSALSIFESAKTMVATSEQVKNMKLENEPIEVFRGRTRHEYKPKNALRRNGEPSKINSPSYFADRFNNHWLNLLVCYEEYSLRLSYPTSCRFRWHIC
jgi:hypothetical protein